MHYHYFHGDTTRPPVVTEKMEQLAIKVSEAAAEKVVGGRIKEVKRHQSEAEARRTAKLKELKELRIAKAKAALQLKELVEERPSKSSREMREMEQVNAARVAADQGAAEDHAASQAATEAEAFNKAEEAKLTKQAEADIESALAGQPKLHQSKGAAKREAKGILRRVNRVSRPRREESQGSKEGRSGLPETGRHGEGAAGAGGRTKQPGEI